MGYFFFKVEEYIDMFVYFFFNKCKKKKWYKFGEKKDVLYEDLS